MQRCHGFRSCFISFKEAAAARRRSQHQPGYEVLLPHRRCDDAALKNYISMTAPRGLLSNKVGLRRSVSINKVAQTIIQAAAPSVRPQRQVASARPAL